jgi:membrane protease YdiL (CAAX protease family)
MLNKLYKILNPENEFFTLATNAKRLPHIGFSSLLLPLMFILLAAIFSQILIMMLTLGDPDRAGLLASELFILIGLFSLSIAALWLWMQIYEERSFWTVGLTKSGWFKKYLSGFGLGILMLGCTIGMMAIWGGIQFEADSLMPTGEDAILPVILFLFGFIIQGGSEEILIRGWQFQVISVRYKPWIGAVVSSLVFALLHGLNNGINAIAILNLLFFSALLILIVLKDGNLWSACGWHSSWNWAMGSVLGLDVSGNHSRGGVFVDLKTAGPEILSGGEFGPEASIVTSIVLLAGILLVLFSKRKEWFV